MAGGLQKAPQINLLLGAKVTDSQDDYEKRLIPFDAKDYPTDFQSLLKLAEQGDRIAQLAIASMYEKEGDAEQNVQNDRKAFYWYHKVAYWYHKAAEQNDAVAQFNLGCMYQEGRGVAPDPVQAYKWFKISAINGFEPADEELQKIKKQMTAEKITEAERLAREWLQDYEKRRK